MTALYQQHTKETDQVFIDGAIDLAWELTCGQPFNIYHRLAYQEIPNYMKTILLIRHPETIDPTRFYGSTDVGLSQKGEVQAASLCTRLVSENLDLVYSSPMKRTLHPAGLICKQGQIALVKQIEL